MTIKKGDFIKLNYTGTVVDSNFVFDTTIKEIAQKNNIFDPNAEYEPAIICLGQGHILRGIDEFLEGKTPGKYSLIIEPEKAFGKKDAKMIQLIPTMKFKKQRINPEPGLQVNVDGYLGIIKSVSGGRTIVDFNHPLSGKELKYDLDVIEIVNDNSEKVKAIIHLLLGIPNKDIIIEIKDNKSHIKTPHKIPETVTKELQNKIKELVGIDSFFDKV